MPRFNANRWWTLILTLCLSCAFVASVSAQTPGARMLDELGGQAWGGGHNPPPPGDGDPDIPMSSVKQARQLRFSSTVRVAGDGARVESVMMWHWRLMLQSLKLWSVTRL
jgi:hypothetical protein